MIAPCLLPQSQQKNNGKKGKKNTRQCGKLNAINLPFRDGLYRPSMMIGWMGMVYIIGPHCHMVMGQKPGSLP